MEMRKVITIFDKFRIVAHAEHKENITLRQKLQQCQLALANKSPVNEAEYAFDERTPLSLYDSFIPQLREHRKFKFDTSQFMQEVVDDYQTKAQELAIDREIKEFELNKATEKN